MGLLGNVWAALKGAPKMTEDIFDKDAGLLVKAGGFMNKLHYSEEEKAIDNREQGKAATEFVKATLGENTEKSRTRRQLAVMWIKVQLYLVLITVICIPLSVVFPEKGKEIFTMMYKITTSGLMMLGTGVVMTYFFGSYGWGTYIKGGKK